MNIKNQGKFASFYNNKVNYILKNLDYLREKQVEIIAMRNSIILFLQIVLLASLVQAKTLRSLAQTWNLNQKTPLLHLKDQKSIDEALKYNKSVIILFGSDYLIDYRTEQIYNKFVELQKRYKDSVFAYAPMNDVKYTTYANNVQVIPTIVYFAQSKQIAKISDSIPEKLDNFIKDQIPK
ncbi:transmembrane protein, putative (macronuclear) [Tetrahymena thermophila SB210]|uniref:Transmembrane protein, putative n=1 Tax=Tetrahymena thermophila (strain SB210) TaxID=312017 RepID=Q23AG6_TETTS|nr:transmembrane protein, putative [Tetrahymena thermophila SB210]EAR93526.2 transmembrane protein, putative [Tetrahymena thermophila SB210]|eukprot:XP_001013771.2 transmembrane protein, putative [Tetrahymena thermophila SB210]